MWATNARHIYNFKFSSSHNLKMKKNTGKILLTYVMQTIKILSFHHVINKKVMSKIFCILYSLYCL